MTLVSSGTINLKGSAADPTRSIEYECEGAVSGTFALTTAQGIASAYVGTLPTGLTDFYGYSGCSESIPSVPTGVSASWIINGVISVSFTKAANADGVDIQRSPDNSNWSDLVTSYTGSSPYSSSNSCAYLYYKVRAYNCAGDSNYSGSTYSGNCP